MQDAGALAEVEALRRRVAELEAENERLRRAAEPALARLHARFGPLLQPTHSPHLPTFWVKLGRDVGWRRCLSPRQMSWLLSEDERLYFVHDTGATPAEFLGVVLSRLPRLEVLVLAHVTGLAAAVETDEAATFPCLRALDLRESDATDDVVHALLALMPRLQELDLSGCRGVRWETIAYLQRTRPELTVLPRTREAKAAEDAAPPLPM